MFDAKTDEAARAVRRGLTALAIPAAALVGLAPRAAADPAGVAPPPAPVSAAAVAYAGDLAYVNWQAAPGQPSDEFVVEAQLVTPSGSQVVSTQTAAGTDTIVTGLTTGDTYSFSVQATNTAGASVATVSSPIQAVGAVPPGTPTGLTLTPSAQDNEATVSWNTPSTSPAPEWYNIGVFEGTATSQTQVGAFSCYAPCTSKNIELDPGTVASVHLSASDTAGTSGYAFSNWISVAQPCPLACLAVDATSPGAPESHPASGFLHAVGPKTSANAIAGVAPLHWRVSQAWNSQAEEGRATSAGADLTEILSDDWFATHNVGGYAQYPWADWTGYQQWVTSEVQTIEAQGRAQGFSIGYWEVQNEPGAGYYYSASAIPPASVTVANLEQQFLVAYHAIRAADLTAKVVAPSLMAWAATPRGANGGLDMRTFLDFCVFNGIAPDAIAFHDNQSAPLFDEFAPNYEPSQPANVEGEVAQLRAMLVARPSLGSPDILINEYGSPDFSQVPGWDVGYISALEAAGVTEANRSCWNTCTDGSLDGLLTGDGVTTLPGYWVYDFYAGMQGQQLPVTSSFTDVTGLATVNGSGTVQVLVGRHQGCNPATSPTCPAAPPAPASISVRVPFAGNASVASALIPAGSAALAAPVTQPAQTISVAGGVVTITTPALSDGDAIEISVTPGPGSYPAQPASTQTSLATSPGAVVVGQPATYTAAVSSSAAGASGTVTFAGASGTLCTSPVDPSTATASCTTTYAAPGSDSVTASYSGDAGHGASTSSASTVTIGPDATTVTVNSDQPAPVSGQPITFTITVAPVGPGSSVPTGTVAVGVAGTGLCTATLNGGSPDQAVCAAAEMTAGSVAVTASYSGDANDAAAASAALAITVSASPTTTSVTSSDPAPVVGETVTLSASVAAASPGTGTPTGAVTFVGMAGPLCSATLDQAAPDRASCTTTYPSPGPDAITASYGGDANYSASASSPVAETVSAAGTTTAVSATPSAAVVGQPVTYSAAVAPVAPGQGEPAGSVVFNDPAGPLCSGAVNPTTGAATCTTSYSTAQADSVTASYSGSADFSASVSQPIGETVSPASTVTSVAASTSSPRVGQAVTYTATVTVSAPGSGVPTGTVSFTGSGGTLCHAAALTGSGPYQATCTTTYPAAGTDSVAAVYSGDANDVASSALPVQVSIQAAATTTTLGGPSSAVAGQPVTYTATVTTSAPASGTPVGSVTFSDSAGTLCTVTLGTAAPAKAACPTTYTTTASVKVTATFAGSANFAGSQNSALTAVGAAATTTTVASTPKTSVTGQALTLVATVAVMAPSTAAPAGQVTFTVDTSANKPLACTGGNTVTLKSGQASCSIAGKGLSPSVAPLLVVATYAGAAATQSSQTSLHYAIGADPTTTGVVSSRNSSPATNTLTFTATVKAATPGAGVPAGSVTFKFSTGSYACSGGDVVALNSSGVATCKIGGSIRTSFTVTGTYNGSTAYGSSAGSAQQTIT